MAIVDSHNFFAKGRYLFIVFGSVSIPPPILVSAENNYLSMVSSMKVPIRSIPNLVLKRAEHMWKILFY